MYPAAATDFRADQARLAAALIASQRRAWQAMGTDFDTGWTAVGPRIEALAASAQLTVARRASAYVAEVLDEQGISAEPLGRLEPRAFAGRASDGRELRSLMYSAVTHAKQAVRARMSTPEALSKGAAFLDMAAATQVADAARSAVSVETAIRPQVTGYIRELRLPSCSRCVVLAGRFYKWNAGFARHPRCDCQHVPTTEPKGSPMLTNPRAAIESGQVRGLSASQREAIGDGADPAQVINADRRVLVGGQYVSKSSGMTTAEGASRLGIAGKRLRAPERGTAARLTPEGIYSIASSRTEAIELLRGNGYIK